MVDEMREKSDDESNGDEVIDGIVDASFSSLTVANTIANSDPASLPECETRSDSPKNLSMIALRRQQSDISIEGQQPVNKSMELVIPQIEPLVVAPPPSGVENTPKLSSGMASVLKRKAVQAKETVKATKEKAVPEAPALTKKQAVPSAAAGKWKKAVAAVKSSKQVKK